MLPRQAKHSSHGRDLARAGTELPALITPGWRKNFTMPERYTERQAADRGAVARYYQSKE